MDERTVQTGFPPPGLTPARLALGLFALTFVTSAARAATSYKQPGFSETVVFTGLVNPTTVRFLPDGRVIVAEKSGLIKLFPSL